MYWHIIALFCTKRANFRAAALHFAEAPPCAPCAGRDSTIRGIWIAITRQPCARTTQRQYLLCLFCPPAQPSSLRCIDSIASVVVR